MAKPAERPAVYRLKVTIRHVRPPVWRRLEVPGDVTLSDLHRVLQAAFGWSDSHLHQFVVGGRFYGEPDPENDWGPTVVDERRVRLGALAAQGVKKLVYEYDFGDGWEHDVVVEKATPPESGVAYPRCLAGRRACPLEDSGGPWGYANLLTVLGDPEHPEHAELREWAGEELDPEAFDIDMINAALRPRPRRRSSRVRS